MTAERVALWLFEHASVALPAALIVLLAVMWWIGRPRRWWKWLLHVPVVLAAIVVIALFAYLRTVSRELEQRTNKITFQPLAGGPVRTVRDYRGKVVVLNYWATWCLPCRKEMPALNQLADQYRGRDVVVLELSDEDPELLRRFTAQYPMHGNVGRYSEPQAGRHALPATVVLGRDGHVVTQMLGAHSFGDFDAAVRKAL